MKISFNYDLTNVRDNTNILKENEALKHFEHNLMVPYVCFLHARKIMSNAT